MTDEELIARLRAGCSCNIDSTPCGAESECRDAFAAADLIEEYGRAYTHLLREFDKRGDRIEALVKERDEAWKRAAYAEKMWGEAEARAALKGADHE